VLLSSYPTAATMLSLGYSIVGLPNPESVCLASSGSRLEYSLCLRASATISAQLRSAVNLDRASAFSSRRYSTLNFGKKLLKQISSHCAYFNLKSSTRSRNYASLSTPSGLIAKKASRIWRLLRPKRSSTISSKEYQIGILWYYQSPKL
jgi:hypothetical protein